MVHRAHNCRFFERRVVLVVKGEINHDSLPDSDVMNAGDHKPHTVSGQILNGRPATTLISDDFVETIKICRLAVELAEFEANVESLLTAAAHFDGVSPAAVLAYLNLPGDATIGAGDSRKTIVRNERFAQIRTQLFVHLFGSHRSGLPK